MRGTVAAARATSATALRRARLGFALLVGVAVAMRINNGLRYPALHGYDGFGHVTYIWYLLKNRQIPLAHEGWEHFHPPLYYALCAAIWSLLASIEPKYVLQVLGLVFSMLGLLSAWVSWAMVRAYFPDRPLAQLAAPLFVLFLPVHIYTAPMIGNEALNTVLCSLALYLLVRTLQTERIVFAAGLGVVLGLGMLTKATTLVYVGTSGVVITLWALRTGKWRTAFVHLCVIGVLVLAIAGWFYARSALVYGTPFQMGRQYLFNRLVENRLPSGRRDVWAYLTFDPSIFANPMFVAGPVVNSVWTGAFASTWYDALGNWFLPSMSTKGIGRIILVLAVVPSALVAFGMLVGLWRLWRDGWNDVLVTMLAAAAAILAMFVVYTYDNRIFAAVKAAYMLAGIVPFSFCFALGLATVAAWGRAVATIVLVELGLLVAVIVPVYTYHLLYHLALGGAHWNTMGVVEYFAGFKDQARTRFDLIVSSMSPRYVAYENKASLALEDGDVEMALQQFEQARRVLGAPGQVMGRPAEREALIRATGADYENTLAVIHDRLGHAKRARRSARRAIELDPTLPEAHYDLGILLLKEGEPAYAARFFRRAAELDPGFREARLMLGVAQQRAGDCDASRRTIETALALRRWPRRMYSHATGMGDIEDAAIVRRRRITDLPPSLGVEAATAACRGG
jgi:tetratricopeptide (TPR) repeat protein